MVSNTQQLKYVLTAIAAINAKAEEGALQPAVTNDLPVMGRPMMSNLDLDAAEDERLNALYEAMTLYKDAPNDENKALLIEVLENNLAVVESIHAEVSVSPDQEYEKKNIDVEKFIEDRLAHLTEDESSPPSFP